MVKQFSSVTFGPSLTATTLEQQLGHCPSSVYPPASGKSLHDAGVPSWGSHCEAGGGSGPPRFTGMKSRALAVSCLIADPWAESLPSPPPGELPVTR